MTIKNYLTSGFFFTKNEFEIKLKYQFFNILLALNIAGLFVATLGRLSVHNYARAIADFAFVMMGIIIVYLLRKNKKYFYYATRIMLLFSLLTVLAMLIHDQNVDVGLGWVFVLILITFFLTNPTFSFSLLTIASVTIILIGYLQYDIVTIKGTLFGLFPLLIFALSLGLYDKRNRLLTKLLKEKNALLENLSYQLENYDKVSNLPNRKLFYNSLSVAVDITKKFSIITINLDNFNAINDSYGHAFGDKVLAKVASRLQAKLSSYDSLSKIGPDDFIFITTIVSHEELEKLTQSIHTLINEGITVETKKVFLTASIGIALYPENGNSTDALIQNVDLAVHQAKKQGKNCTVFYTKDLTHGIDEKLLLLGELKEAIAHNQFEVYFQPQVNAKLNTLDGLEALVRWNHPTKGIISPSTFIHLAEEHGLIETIDMFVMDQAMRAFLVWKKRYPNMGKLSLNLSIKLLESPNYLTTLQKKLDTLHFDPKWLELEITENHLMQNPLEALNILEKIHALGIELAIDDFGTGYSSLAYVQKLPVDKLKIDRAFVLDITQSENGANLVKSIIGITQALQLKVIAEGVEFKKERDFLLENKCDFIQGYFYSVPLCEKDYTNYLENFFTHS